jgi:hypothetical protein
MPALELPGKGRVRILECGEAQVVVMSAIVLAAVVAIELAEVVAGEEAGGGFTLEAVDEASEVLGGEDVVVVGLAHAVGAALGERVLLELEGV